MLSAPLRLNQIDAGKIIAHLYAIFRRDFVDSKAMLNGQIWIDPQSNRTEDGCEASFWHLTSREQYETAYINGKRVQQSIGRYPDMDRACRLEWVRQIIDSPSHDSIRMFYYQENNAKRSIRLYLWVEAEDFVVILQKLGRGSAYLVTSFFLDNPGKRASYRSRCDAYVAQTNPALKGCSWFK